MEASAPNSRGAGGSYRRPPFTSEMDSTNSTEIEVLGYPLFDRVGGRLRHTQAGEIVFGYTEEIFRMGAELQETMQDAVAGRAPRLRVGVPDAAPKLIVYRPLAPALKTGEELQLVVREGQTARLIGAAGIARTGRGEIRLAGGRGRGGGTYSHLLGECRVLLMASAKSAPRCRRELFGPPGR